MFKKIYLILIFTLMISLTGCGNSKEVRKIKKEAIKLAEQYYQEKYNENLNVEDYSVYVYREDRSGYPLPIPGEPLNKVLLTNKKDNYSIFVNLDDDAIADTKQLEEIKKDTKEYIKNEYFVKNDINLDNTIIDREFLHGRTFEIYSLSPEDDDFYMDYNSDYRIEGFLDKDTIYNGDIEEFIRNNNLGIYLDVHFKATEEISDTNTLIKYEEKFSKALKDIQEDFNGNDTYISFRLYKSDKYMNQDIKDIYEKQTTSWSDSDRYIYSSDFVYLHMYSKKINETNEWETSSIYDKYVEIDKGVYASSTFNRKFETKNDLNYFKYPIYAFTEDLAIFSKEIVNEELELKEFIDENLIEKTKTNLDGDIVLSNVYSFSYNYNLFTELKENKGGFNNEQYINIKLNKKDFENGLLLDNTNQPVLLYKDSENRDNFKTIPFTKGFIYEDDEYVYLTVSKDEDFAIANLKQEYIDNEFEKEFGLLGSVNEPELEVINENQI